jgi:hypothetical protein
MYFSLSFRSCFTPILLILCSACDPCDNHILQEELTPDRTQKAVVFQRQCGSFGGTSTQVSVLPASARPFAGGNIFGADTNANETLAMPSGGPPIAVKWINEHELQVSYDGRIRVFQSEKKLGDVAITYNVQSTTEPNSVAPPPKQKKK